MGVIYAVAFGFVDEEGGGLRGYKGDRIINGIYFMKSEKLIQQNVRLVYVNV